VVITLLAGLAVSEAGELPRWGGGVSLTTAFTPGPWSPGTSGRTLTGAWSTDGTFDPRVDLGLGLRVVHRWHDTGMVALSWSLWRDQRVVDTVDEGFRPGNGGTSTTQLVDTGDLVLSALENDLVHHGVLHLALGGRATIPASRRSLVCDPMAGALGATVGGWVDVRGLTQVAVSLGADRAFFVHPAAPRGACSMPLVGDTSVATLTGDVAPTRWTDTWATAPNSAWTADGTLSIQGWHALFGFVPAVGKHPAALARVTSDASVGVRLNVSRRDPAATVSTLSGDVELAPSRTPAVTSFPWSLGLGVRLVPALTLRASVSNTAPALLWDPSARIRALPATTTVALGLLGQW
jgi:hypothetical protein